jgi:predicted component of type VI protein secretion system
MGLLNRFRKVPHSSKAQQIAESLSNLLNTKQNFGAWQERLGLGDYSYGNFSDEIVNKIGEDIRYNIEQFEPRLKLSKLCFPSAKNPFNLCFTAEGTIEGRAYVFLITFSQNRKSEIKVYSSPTTKLA